MNIWEEVKKVNKDVIEWRRQLHQNPEIACDLPKTTQFVMDKLKVMGYDPQEICKSSVVALVGKKAGKTILLRGDMDALPIVEETNESFKSTNQYMHACGHDMHTAMLLGVAKILKEHEDELNGQVKFMFQPGEEVMEGAKNMIDAGVLQNPRVDAALASHVFSQNPPGVVTVSPGANTASSDIFRITIQGIGCHGAMPDTGIDPINIGCHMILNIQTINARENNPSEPLVITIGKFQGGHASNIIPDKVVLEGTIRTFNADVRAMAKKRLVEIVEGTAVIFRASADLEFLHGAPPLVVEENYLNEISQYTREILTDKQFQFTNTKLMGSEDFAYIAEKVPSVFFMVTAGVGDHPYPQHHPKVEFDESVMELNMAVLVHNAIRWLEN